MKKKKVLVACGSGIATSTLIMDKLKNGLEERGVDIELEQCKISEAKNYIEDLNLDIIILNGPVNSEYDIPAFSGVSFLTGVGEEKLLDEIEDELRN
ncbi:PTS sugar transporter subunit IIB [Halanaerobium hydrogeniformans]|uniref:Phosphotransferase system lactose/cellobiose-specific IIB subunit n=1 Tax=Halanaerobium hydrogeniformans TaxID=656519 RepID=E4RM21_HALHG|nr:PTS sugar transporter subunit IIB [Halanaerobium hydrogeniformans]ADQ14104.1 phosphotransferase system lactose/cellobiose-specific IIB subunit [Halanaerobium hydrogeniformans]